MNWDPEVGGQERLYPVNEGAPLPLALQQGNPDYIPGGANHVNMPPPPVENLPIPELLGQAGPSQGGASMFGWIPPQPPNPHPYRFSLDNNDSDEGESSEFNDAVGDVQEDEISSSDGTRSDDFPAWSQAELNRLWAGPPYQPVQVHRITTTLSGLTYTTF